MNSSNYANCSTELNCTMTREQKGEFDVIAILRIIMSSLSILGAFSIVGSATYRRTMCNPKVHPLFMLSVVDMMVSVMWITGSSVWLSGSHTQTTIVGCFTINLTTVILQCIAMNVTLIYAMLAYSSIKQKDFSGVYNDITANRQAPYVHVWRPFCSFSAYLIAWTLPLVLVLSSFSILTAKFSLVSAAKTCSCWCLPFYGNVLPRPNLGYDNNTQDRNHYLHHLHYHVGSYSIVLCLNFAIVFLSMIFLYFKTFQRIRRMRHIQEQNENTPAIHGATQAMIVEGENDAKKRVFLFLSIFFVTGIPTFILGIVGIVIVIKDIHTNYFYTNSVINHKVMVGIFAFFVSEALLVPLQGFLNAIAYGWTRGDFLSVMSSKHNLQNFSESLSHSYGSVDRRRIVDPTCRDGEEEDYDREVSRPIDCRLSESMRRRRDGSFNCNTMAVTPGTPD